jgi:hypothetical protein
MAQGTKKTALRTQLLAFCQAEFEKDNIYEVRTLILSSICDLPCMTRHHSVNSIYPCPLLFPATPAVFHNACVCSVVLYYSSDAALSTSTYSHSVVTRYG